MNLVLTGSLGHIGRPLTGELVQRGHDVTVVSSKPERKGEIEALGAKAAIGTLENLTFVSAVFQGADAVFILIAPNGFTDPQIDVKAKFRQIGENCIDAIEASGVRRVVYQSSFGADLDSGTGPLLLHHAMEERLNRLREVAITIMRPTGFHDTLYNFIPTIKLRGVIAADYGEDDKVEWVSPRDIATAAAEELEALYSGGANAGARKVRYVCSDELTCNQTARILGEAIGKPDLKWVRLPGEQVKERMVAAGMKPSFADEFIEMNATYRSGRLTEDYYRHRPVLGPVKMADFAKEFAAAYNRI